MYALFLSVNIFLTLEWPVVYRSLTYPMTQFAASRARVRCISLECMSSLLVTIYQLHLSWMYMPSLLVTIYQLHTSVIVLCPVTTAQLNVLITVTTIIISQYTSQSLQSLSHNIHHGHYNHYHTIYITVTTIIITQYVYTYMSIIVTRLRRY